ncbi:hypothetical protein [Streptomyces lancefieldiae]|uniref:Uncharacterized protein n=1 Tax=Streptomyces lancefieldiae TaxID=3075520 RepID=A0ABU3AWW9_9ACTN|nr:hypothetical protein [Streptomyces sp. DSM 40712]MDT0613573.1 hypothetical protein [Streptomyces sp. DSM 40712]
MFGRSRHEDEHPVPIVPWTDAWEFAVSDEERPATEHRKRAVPGLRAVRVPQGGGLQRVNAPCAFFPPEATSSDSPQRLYEDPAGQRLLCSVDAPRNGDGTRQYGVRDAEGELVGHIHRVAPLKHALRPTWRLDQPGHPEIVSSAEWAKNGPAEMVQRGAGKLLLGVVQAISDMGAEGGDQPGKTRVVEWKSGGELVMTSENNARFLIRAAWLDRRLAFAYALLRSN